MALPYFLMASLAIFAICAALLLRHQRAITAKIGFICWISLSVYFIIDYLVIQATTTPYNFLEQPMSDLGVTTCGTDTYVLSSLEICSPYHLLMNWTFTFTGIVIFVGAIFLHQFWQDNRKTRIATIFLIIFGFSYTMAGIFPADVNFLWHTLPSIPGMIVQIPALILIALSIRKEMPKLSVWTFICALITTTALILMSLYSFIDLFGLLQRILYGSVYLWMIITAITLWRKKA
ncbi:DUF998 domain-containing protein [Salicibibacter cibarius]|uniref:DUF998 domain-containing protein n=1 Tax=Salicibibacter cibarius TaxID=2743000 RepID=A0A7T6Z574_9BACI|nr:DUF998 domain-containing protein [Salicibibacter cibarius]QQK77110.1 DUF998 domain-containing protein [Salicibibacter cibarius]